MNLDDIKDRCTEVGDCLEWQGYYERNHPRSAGQSVRRIVYELVHGPVESDPKKVVTMTCDNHRCVHPDHLAYVKKTVVARRVASKGLFSTLIRKQRIAETRRQQSGSITMEIAREIRASDLNAKEEAKQRGISRGMVYKIRAHETWREYGANHFAGLM